MAGRLNGKGAIITGAARGMGKVEAELFAKEGAKVVAADILEDEVKKVAEDIVKAGHQAIAFKLDVSKSEDWKKVVDKVVEKWGKVDVLVNNAGIFPTSGNRNSHRRKNGIEL